MEEEDGLYRLNVNVSGSYILHRPLFEVFDYRYLEPGVHICEIFRTSTKPSTSIPRFRMTHNLKMRVQWLCS